AQRFLVVLVDMRQQLLAEVRDLALLGREELHGNVMARFGVNFQGRLEVVVASGMKANVSQDQESGVAADGDESALRRGADPGLDLAEIESRHESDIELQSAADAFYHPHDLASRPLPAAAAHGEEVDDARLAARRAEGGHQHQASLQVLAVRAEAPLGADLEVAAVVPVEQTPEAAVRIEARQATPVDRALPGDERRRVTVADERVVRDGRVLARPLHSRCRSSGQRRAALFGSSVIPPTISR